MIKKAKKSVAVGLSVALAVTSVNIPVNSASAAAKKAKLSATKKTLTAGKSTTLTLKTNKKKAKTIKTIKAKYVKVSTSKKSVATVKKVSKKSKVTGIKVTAKKAGKATITVKVTKGTYKGTYKCKVTVKKKASATKKPTQKPTEVPTATPEVTVEPTVEPTTTPAITAEPSTTPAITATPATKVTVVNTSNITKSDDTFTVTLTLDGTYTDEQLKGAKVTLTNSAAKVTTTATFSKIDVDGKAVFTVDDTKVLTPGDTTANGDYKVSSDSEALVISGDVVASYEESLAGNKIKGYVLTDDKLNNGTYDGSFKNAVAGATVSVEGGQSTTTDAKGYYELPSVAGRKIVTISKAGFVTKYLTGTKRVYVNKSHVTSQNVALEHFDVRKLTVNVKAIDKDAKTGISKAHVVLKNSAGAVVKEGDADANGQITFGNDLHESAAVGTDLTANGTSDANYLNQGTYTLEVSKKLSKSNVSDVYATFTKSFKIENDYTYPIEIEGTKTAAVKSFKVTQNLKENAEKAYVNSSSRINVKYALYTLVDGNAVSAPIIENTAAVESDAITSAKTLTSNILSALITSASANDTVLAAASNKALTLPTGDYYLLLTPELASGATGYTFAYNAVKVSVTAGGDVTATADLTEGNVRTINTQVTLPNKVAGDDVQTDTNGNGLFTVKWDATTKKFVLADEAAPFNKEQVKASYAISQVVAGTDDKVAIKIPENGNFTTPEYNKGADGAYASSVKYVNFLGTGKYIIESTGDYTTSVAKQTEQIKNDKGSVNFKVAGAANVVKVTVKAVAGSDVIGKNTFGKLTKLVAYDSTGKAVATKDYTATTAADKQVTGQDLLASGSAITGSAIAVNDYAEYNTQTGNYTMNLPEGKYTFGVTLAGYKEVVSDAVDVNAIEKVGITISKKLEKATADATTINGEVKVLNENKIGYMNLTSTSLTNGTVVLLNSDKKIAAIDTLKWDASKNVYTYSFYNGEADGSGKNVINPGTYTMVVRTSQTETYATTVTVVDGEKKAANVDLVKGAYGQIKAFALDNNSAVLTDLNAVAVAYDEYFVDPAIAGNYADGKISAKASAYPSATQGTISTITENTARFGAYLTSSTWSNGSYSYAESNNGVTQKGYYVFDKLPAGTYTVKLGVNVYNPTVMTDNLYQWKAETVTLKDSGDVVKAEYTYDKIGEKVNTISVPLTINLKGTSVPTPSLTNPLVVVIAPTKGAGTETITKIVTDPRELKEIPVAGKTNYDVTVFTYDGYQLASNSINVERSAATVEVALNASDMD